MSWWDSYSGGSGSIYNFGNAIKDFTDSGSSSGGSGWGSLVGAATSLLGNSGSSGSGSTLGGLTSALGGSSNIWGSLLSGIGTGAAAYLSGKDLKDSIETKGKEERKTLSYAASLEDFYKQKDKARKKAAVDTYGQYSLMSRIMPTADTPVDVPTMPTA